MHRIVALCALCFAWCGAYATRGEQQEVALGVDGSVVDETRPIQAAASDLTAQSELQSTAELQQDVVAVVTTLQQQLAAVEGMVKLQEKKLQVLETMRTLWLQEVRQEGRRRAKGNVAQMIERRLDAAIAETVAGPQGKHFEQFFVERAATRLQGRVVDVKMVKIRATSAVELLAVAYTDGVVLLSTSVGEELLRIRTERQGIKAIALASQEDQPCLVVTFEDSVIALYALHLVEKSHGGPDVERDNDEEKSTRPSPSTISTRPEYVLNVGEHQDVQMSATASAVAIARSSRQLVVAIAQVDGLIDFLALNGTSLRQIQTNAAITAMETRRNLLAFSNGTDVVVSSMTRAQGPIYHSCPGSSAGVSSITFDAVHPEIMYAGTYRGEVLVYAVNAGQSAEGQGCRLLTRSTVTKRARELIPVALVTTKMYVIAAGPQDITVFNVSISQKNGASLSRVCTNHLGKSVDLPQDQQSNQVTTLLAMAFSEGMMGSHLAFITANSEGLNKLVLFHSLLPDEREVSDFEWTVFLYAGIVIVAVVGSQLFIRWQRQSSVNPWDSIGKARDLPFGKYGGLKDNEAVPGFDGEDFGRYNSLSDELRRKVAQVKRGATHRPIHDEADY